MVTEFFFTSHWIFFPVRNLELKNKFSDHWKKFQYTLTEFFFSVLTEIFFQFWLKFFFSSNKYFKKPVDTLFKILKYWTTLFPWGFFTWFGLNITWIYINNNQKLKIMKKKNHGFKWIRRPLPPWFCLAQALISQNQRKNVKRSTNWAIEALVEMSPKLKNTSMYL